MSGHTYDVITRQGVLSEGVPLISKPLTPGELLVKIREVLVSPSQHTIQGEAPSKSLSIGDARNNE